MICKIVLAVALFIGCAVGPARAFTVDCTDDVCTWSDLDNLNCESGVCTSSPPG